MHVFDIFVLIVAYPVCLGSEVISMQDDVII